MKENKSGKINQANTGSKSNNFETNTKTEDLALANIVTQYTGEKEYVPTEEEIKDAVVYENGVTSLDFIMPEEEKKILEKNLNNYSDVEKMQKVLTMAKKNKLLSEDVKTLQQISNTDMLIENMFDVMNNPENLAMIDRYIRQKLNAGQDVAKAYKEIGLMTKAMMDAREGMINKLKATKSGRKARILAQFVNDSGETTQLGAEIDV